MTTSNDRVSRGRPMSTVALNFSAALDDLFRLGAVGELEDTVEQKNREVASQKLKLEGLDAQLREADERLKHLELKHKRMSRCFSERPSVQGLFHTDTNSDTDEAGAVSPNSESSEPARS